MHIATNKDSETLVNKMYLSVQRTVVLSSCVCRNKGQQSVEELGSTVFFSIQNTTTRLPPFLFGQQTVSYLYKLRHRDVLKGLVLVVRSGVNSKFRSPFNGWPGFLLPAGWCCITKLSNFTT